MTEPLENNITQESHCHCQTKHTVFGGNNTITYTSIVHFQTSVNPQSLRKAKIIWNTYHKHI